MGIQFRIVDILLYITLVCIGLSIEKAIGGFLVLLICGLFAIAFVVRLLDVESVMAGAVGGFVASAVMYYLMAMLQPFHDPTSFAAGCFAYPALGLGVGMVTVADRMIREGR